MQDHAEAEDVAAVIGIQSAHLFRRHVADGAHDHAGARRGAGIVMSGWPVHLRHPRQTEIEDLGAAVARQQDVVGLEIAVDDTGRVRRARPLAIWAAMSSVFRSRTGRRATARRRRAR